MSLGVCLPGGGAKGAFQAVCWNHYIIGDLKDMIHMPAHQLEQSMDTTYTQKMWIK